MRAPGNSLTQNDLLDEEGKARFGTPCPGEYVMPGSLGETVVYNTSSSYSFGIKPEAHVNLYISKQHSKATGGMDSPGPSYLPNYKVTKKSLGSMVFSTADRDTESLRYISRSTARTTWPRLLQALEHIASNRGKG